MARKQKQQRPKSLIPSWQQNVEVICILQVGVKMLEIRELFGLKDMKISYQPMLDEM